MGKPEYQGDAVIKTFSGDFWGDWKLGKCVFCDPEDKNPACQKKMEVITGRMERTGIFQGSK